MKNLILFLFSILLLSLGIFFVIQGSSKPPVSKLAQKIDQDLTEAQRLNFFPEKVTSLSQIQIVIHTNNQSWKEKILKSLPLTFEKSKEGKYSLQIDVIENFTPSTEAILILQFNLFDNMTKNKIWENSRIYHLSKEDLQEF